MVQLKVTSTPLVPRAAVLRSGALSTVEQTSAVQMNANDTCGTPGDTCSASEQPDPD